MPKTNFCKPHVDPRIAEVRAMIVGNMAKQELLQAGLAKKAGLPGSTLSKRLRDPRSMRLGELWDILDVLKPDENEKAKII